MQAQVLQVLAPRQTQVLAALALCLLLLCAASGCSRESPPAFDLPAAAGADFRADIDALTSRLGKPQSETPPQNGVATRTWSKDSVSLSASFKEVSRRVVNIAVTARADADALGDEGKLKMLRAANLPENEGGAGYSIEWIEARDRPTFYTGFRVVPAPRTHRITLRATGTDAILSIAFAPATAAPSVPGGAPGGPFEAATPWETSFEAPDDARIVLSSRIFESIDKKTPFFMRLQIEVDGKIVRDQTSKGLPLTIEYEI
jgi:hypothetical protein